MPPHVVAMMLGCGAGAGIAGIFKAPIGGALFTVEVLGMAVTSLAVVAVVAASVTAAMTAYVLSGSALDLAFGGGDLSPCRLCRGWCCSGVLRYLLGVLFGGVTGCQARA